jgi:hypothetical protein
MPGKESSARLLGTGGRVIALLGLLGLAAGCGSVPGSAAGDAAKDAAATRAAATAHPAAAGTAGVGTAGVGTAAAGAGAKRAAGKPAGISKSQIIWDKEHGIIPPVPPGGTAVKHADLLNGVSCAGTACVAVGYYYYGASEHNLAELWTGTAWVLEPSPKAPKDPEDGMLGVAWSGSHWRLVAVPDGYSAVSCPAADACVAVATTTRAPVFAAWNGSTWRTGAMHPLPAKAQEFNLAGVSCTSAANCVAVGDYSYGITARPGPSYRDDTLAELWNGRSWRLLASVNVGHNSQLTAVSCAAPDDCTAVGTTQRQDPLAEHWNGKAWRVEAMPTAGTGYIELSGVSCPAAGFCAAAGNYQGLPVAETWNGARWRLTFLPQPPVDNHSAGLNGVSCVSPASCMAVGVGGDAGSYAERYAAGTWRLSATQNPL